MNATATMQLNISGMTCISCQQRIEARLRATAGIASASVSYRTGRADIVYDPHTVSLKEIFAVVEKLGYRVLTRRLPGARAARAAGLVVLILALYWLLEQFGLLNMMSPGALAEAGMGYGMLFVIGLMTSVHCVAMCGGINLSQCLPRGESHENSGRFSSFRPAALYNLGRVVSYTAVGFLVGALGSAITFSLELQGVLKLIAGVFMVIMGLNMLNVFPWLRRLNPRLPGFLTRGIGAQRSRRTGPFVVGLLNGLMPCGPLQAMQIYALSTGSPLAGALSMLLFSLGTVPLMFGLGALSASLGKRFAGKVVAAGAVLVAVLGLSMLTQGASLTGFSLQMVSAVSTENSQSGSVFSSQAPAASGVQEIRSTLESYRYPSITVEAGRPVKWIIDAPARSINGCNNAMIIPKYGIEHAFTPGENVIEFTPTDTGRFQYSCWMGMIRASISVVEPGGAVVEQAAEPPAELASELPLLPGDSCCQ